MENDMNVPESESFRIYGNLNDERFSMESPADGEGIAKIKTDYVRQTKKQERRRRKIS